MVEQIKKIAAQVTPWAVEIRRHIHAHPELSMEEKLTSALVAEKLQEMGLEVTSGIINHGVMGILKGDHSGPTVLLRADMDALPLQEKTDLPYSSTVPGVMHACGHDGHTALVLGVAKTLSQLKEQIHGTVKFFFQPAEEIGTVCEDFVKEGILENPKVDYALGVHLWGPLKKGTIHVRKGAIMSSTCKFKFRIIGKGGHGSAPQETIDPVAMTICALNDIYVALNRQISPFDNCAVSFCTIHGGQVFNIIPEHVEVEGTIRGFDMDLIARVTQSVESILDGVTKSFGGTYEFEYDHSLPPVINDEKMTERFKASAEKICGKDAVAELEHPSMGSEDYSFISEKVPSCYFFLGISDDMENPPIHHNQHFSWDDSVLQTGIEAMSMATIDLLNRQEP